MNKTQIPFTEKNHTHKYKKKKNNWKNINISYLFRYKLYKRKDDMKKNLNKMQRKRIIKC